MWPSSCIPRHMRWLRAALATVAIFWLGGRVAAAQTMDAQAVVESFEQARANGDVDQALAAFADESVVMLQGRGMRSYAGAAQVRFYLETIGVKTKAVMRSAYRSDGVVVSWTERDRDERQMMDVVGQAIVRSGRITSLTYRQTDAIGAADAPLRPISGREVPSIVWPSALGFGGVLALTIAFAWPRRPASRSELDGRMLESMRRSSPRERVTV
jgi:hypothetical protein